MVTAPTPMGSQVEVEWELLGSDPCCRDAALSEVSDRGFAPISPSHSLERSFTSPRVSLGSSSSTGTSESQWAGEPCKDDVLAGTGQGHKEAGRQAVNHPRLKSLSLAKAGQVFGTNSGLCTGVFICIEETRYPNLCRGLGHLCKRNVLCKVLCEGQGLKELRLCPVAQWQCPWGWQLRGRLAPVQGTCLNLLFLWG